MMATGAVYKIVEVGYLHPSGMIARRCARRGRGRLSHGLHQDRLRHPGRRHRHRRWKTRRPRRCPATRPCSPWSSPASIPADGSKYGDLRDALEKLKLNDASMSYDAGKLHRPGLWLPLRLFGPAAHGDHHGAPGAGVQPRPHHHRAERRLPHHEDRRRRPSRSIPR